MEINKESMRSELTCLLIRVFQLPEVHKVQIRNIEIFSADEHDKIVESIEKCYHDVLSDIDVGIHVTLHPEDSCNGHGYSGNPDRVGLNRNTFLGLAYSDGGGKCQMFRVILKSGIRFDIGFYITEDPSVPIYKIPKEIREAMKEEGNYWPGWDLRKADSFWFSQIHALAKLLRGDYLIADHLANMQINETLVAQMIDRDNRFGTNFHRYGYHEELDYMRNIKPEFQFKEKDQTYNMIADKLTSTAVSYDRLIKNLNPEYEERKHIFFNIWQQYDAVINR